MKKTCLLLSILLAWCTLSFAKEVPVSTAKTVGYNYLLQHGTSALNDADDLNLVYISGNEQKYFYVFSSNNCFVIVSAEDGVVPVLGYSKERAFIGDNIPATVKDFFESYDNQVSYVISNKIAASAEIAADWNKLLNNKMAGTTYKTTAVSPLLTTTWNQSPHYNANCPYDASGGGLSVTGCVATATAQVMKFWNWPSHGTGFHSYATSSYGTLSANFGSTTYNWASMPNNVTGPNAAVATLMQHVGISVNMDYSAAQSSAYVITAASPITNCAEYALRTYFDYKPTMQGVERSSYSDASWIALIEGELNAGRPVIYAGFGTGGGHCFVADGYDASNNFHINWGWGGAGPDGYYYMNSLNPPSLGTGGGGGGFNSGQQAIIGVQPNSVAPTATLELYDYLYLTQSSIQYSDTFSFATNILNSGTTSFSGDLTIAAFDATTGIFVAYLATLTGTSLPSGSVYAPPGLTGTGLWSAAMTPGTYNLAMMYRSASSSSWTIVANGGGGLYINATPLTVVNHNFIELYSTMAATPSPLVQSSAASVSLKVYNNDITAWTDSLYLGLYNLDGTWNSDIQYIAGTSLSPATASGTLVFNTTSVTAAPGTYLLVLWFKTGGSWYVCGADFSQNPVYINVVAPPPPPDIYEVNNTAATAYDLSSTLAWSANVASTSTPGSTIHITTDQDYYKVTLPPGYNYSITARINDVVSKDDASTYTVDALWSYSTNGGSTWSPTYNNTMSGTIVLPGLTGGTIIFHVSPAFPGNTGSYKLKLGNITRSTSTLSIPDIELFATIYPNPASNSITVDLSSTKAKGSKAIFTDVQGRTVLTTDITNQPVATISINALTTGMYFLSVITDAGVISKKITVNK